MQTKHSSVFTFILFLALYSPVSCGKKDSEVKEKCRICKNIAEDFEKVYAHLSFYNAPDICNRLSVKSVTGPDQSSGNYRRSPMDRCGRLRLYARPSCR